MSNKVSWKHLGTNGTKPTLEDECRIARDATLRESVRELAKVSGILYGLFYRNGCNCLDLNFREIKRFVSLDEAEAWIDAQIEVWRSIRAALPADRIVRMAGQLFVVCPRATPLIVLFQYPSLDDLVKVICRPPQVQGKEYMPLAIISESKQTGRIMVSGKHRGKHITMHLHPHGADRYTSRPHDGRCFFWKRKADQVVEIGNWSTGWTAAYFRAMCRLLLILRYFRRDLLELPRKRAA